ncbi:MAG: T9SS type A sorting domain-containing protein [Flavobacteriales bacterium]|nr:T9SS type A sorting domain-containing protein [Flavobacteriales bacterium]
MPRMKVIVLCVVLSGVDAAHCGAQNLVPNGSFEQFDTCPDFSGYAQWATGWYNLHTQSADYFHACSSNGVVGVPFNQFGYQYPADGDGYMGMATSTPGGTPFWYRELVGIDLTDPLIPGVPICLSFQTAMGGFGSWSGNSTPYSCKGLGLKFFTEFPSDWHSYLYPNSAALSLDIVPTDTAIWYQVSGIYTPDSAYTHVVVGNFFADSLNQLTLIDSTGFGTFLVAYAFVDDVRASFDLSYCTATVVEDLLAAMEVQVYPNPAHSVLHVEVPNKQKAGLHYQVIDLTGRVILQANQDNDASLLQIDLRDLSQGGYHLRLFNQQGPLGTARFVRSH